MFSRFRSPLQSVLFVAGVAAFLSACGGGGNGDSDNFSGKPVLTFPTPVVAATVSYGTSTMVPMSGLISDPNAFNGATDVHVFVTDPKGAITDQVEAIREPALITARVFTKNNLATGIHEGVFTLKVCRDSACAKHFPGSPMQLPYKLTVTDSPFSVASNRGMKDVVTIGGSTPTPVTATMSTGANTWKASTNVAWLKLSNTSGKNDDITIITYDLTGMTVGTYNGGVTIENSDGRKLHLSASLIISPQPVPATGLPVSY